MVRGLTGSQHLIIGECQLFAQSHDKNQSISLLVQGPLPTPTPKDLTRFYARSAACLHCKLERTTTMWDMMLMGGGPYGRRHRRGHRRSKTHRKCRACREPIGKVTLYGKRIELPYCQKHHCQKVMGSTVCQEQRNGRNPNWQYCDMRKSRAVLLSRNR